MCSRAWWPAHQRAGLRLSQWSESAQADQTLKCVRCRTCRATASGLWAPPPSASHRTRASSSAFSSHPSHDPAPSLRLLARMLQARTQLEIVGASSSFRRLSTPRVAENGKCRAVAVAVATQVDDGSEQAGGVHADEGTSGRCLPFPARRRSSAYRTHPPMPSSRARCCGGWWLCRYTRRIARWSAGRGCPRCKQRFREPAWNGRCG